MLSDVDFVPQLQAGAKVQIGFSAQYSTPYVVERCLEHGRGALLKLKNVDSVEKAEQLVERGLFVPAATIAPNDDALFSESLMGREAVDAQTMTLLGVVRDVWQTPAHRTLVIETPKGDEVLVPMVSAIVKTERGASGRLLLTAPEGMFPGDEIEDEGTEDA